MLNEKINPAANAVQAECRHASVLADMLLQAINIGSEDLVSEYLCTLQTVTEDIPDQLDKLIEALKEYQIISE